MDDGRDIIYKLEQMARVEYDILLDIIYISVSWTSVLAYTLNHNIISLLRLWEYCKEILFYFVQPSKLIQL